MGRVVLGERVGKKRSFAAGLLLSVATAGVYAIYWNYKAHAEVYRQFELSRENRDEGVLWYILGIILPPFLLAYAWVMSSNVAYVRDRMRLRRSMTPGKFVALVTVGFGSYFAGALALTLVELSGAASPDAASGALTLFGFGALMFLATVPYAYHRLQKDVNELWDAYDARMREITAPPAAEAPAAPAPRYLADLSSDPPP